MKSIVIEEAYGLEKISLADRDMPVVRPDEVLANVQAISLNQLDLMIARGAFGTFEAIAKLIIHGLKQ